MKTSDKHTVTADAVVFATNSPVNDWVTMHTKQAPYRTYVIAVGIPRGSVPPGLYWDTAEPYHYVRLASGAGDEPLLIVGGEDHKTGQADDPEPCHGSRFDPFGRVLNGPAVADLPNPGSDKG